MPGTRYITLCLLFCLATGMLAVVDAVAAPVDAQNAHVARLLNEANRRTASGESTDIVEQWLTQAMQADGMATTPPAWDVYGQKRWQAAQGVNDAAATAMPAFVVSANRSQASVGGYIPTAVATAGQPSLVSIPVSVATSP